MLVLVTLICISKILVGCLIAYILSKCGTCYAISSNLAFWKHLFVRPSLQHLNFCDLLKFLFTVCIE